MFFSKLTACLESPIVYSLKYLLVQFLCLFTVKWKPHADECISQTLNTNSDWTVTKIGRLCLFEKRFIFSQLYFRFLHTANSPVVSHENYGSKNWTEENCTWREFSIEIMHVEHRKWTAIYNYFKVGQSVHFNLMEFCNYIICTFKPNNTKLKLDSIRKNINYEACKRLATDLSSMSLTEYQTVYLDVYI